MEKKKLSPIYRAIVGLLRIFYPRIETIGAENLPDEPCIVVGNHTQMNGPIICELQFPIPRYTWCAGQMMNRSEVPEYAFQDFWSLKPKWTHRFYRILSHMIAPLSAIIFTNANTIAVYRDSRILSTFRATIERLQQGNSIVIFPECSEPHNNIVYNFQEGFIDVARMYHRRTGVELPFVPLYIAPRLRKMYIGAPIRFNSAAPYPEEKERIRRALMDEITRIARSLPWHRVVPYRNIPRKDYPFNIPDEVNPK